MKSEFISSGIIILDKPIYSSSNKIVQLLKILLNIKKIGYVGTLDPLARGCLPILLNRYTRYSELIMKANKTYFANMNLFKVTNTYDSDGILLKKKNISKIKVKKILKLISHFIGNTYQHPPIYSAIKYKGSNLYKYAVLNLQIFIKKKKVNIKSIKLIKYIHEVAEILIKCSSGTYIRSLVSDIGYTLNCGASLSYLKRTKIGLFKLSYFISVPYLKMIKKNERNEMYIKYFVLV